jgi:hypothetical protein
MSEFIDQYRMEFGVEPICRILQIAPSAYRAYAAQQRVATKRSARAQRDARLRTQIDATWRAHRGIWGTQSLEAAASGRHASRALHG